MSLYRQNVKLNLILITVIELSEVNQRFLHLITIYARTAGNFETVKQNF